MIYIACESANFVWRPDDVVEFDRLWLHEKQQDIEFLAKHFKRSASDIAFLIWDRNQRNFEAVPMNRKDKDERVYQRRTKADAKKSQKRHTKKVAAHGPRTAKAHV